MMIEKKKIDFYKDSRGRILFLKVNLFTNLNIIVSKKNSIRGNHYHKKTIQFFLLLSGSVDLFIYDRINNKRRKYNIKEGYIYKIDKNLIHTFKFKKLSKMLEFNNIINDYKNDTYYFKLV